MALSSREAGAAFADLICADPQWLDAEAWLCSTSIHTVQRWTSSATTCSHLVFPVFISRWAAAK
jgi:hypothetical protein